MRPVKHGYQIEWNLTPAEDAALGTSTLEREFFLRVLYDTYCRAGLTTAQNFLNGLVSQDYYLPCNEDIDHLDTYLHSDIARESYRQFLHDVEDAKRREAEDMMDDWLINGPDGDPLP